MPLHEKKIVELYRRRARRYDFTAKLYYLAGFREQAYRKRAVEALTLKRGDRVIEIGCGTGLNFPFLHDAVGPGGRIIGVDLTDAMLDVARERVHQERWSNVELVQSSASGYSLPTGINGVISTYALTLDPAYDAVVRSAAEALNPGGRMVILDFKMPLNWISLLAPLVVVALRPFGVSLDLADRHPWEAMKRHFGNVRLDQLYGGIAYLATSEKSLPATPPPADDPLRVRPT